MTEGERVPTPAGRRGSRTLVVLAFSLLIGLLLAEGLVRLAGALKLVDLSPSLAELAVDQSPADDGVQLAASAGSDDRPLYIGDRVLHHRMSANWAGYFPEEIVSSVGRSEVPIRTNSLGLRSAEIEPAKPAGVFRILVLGDSVTFGWGVRVEDAFPSQLASLLATLRPNDRFEVINAGVSGYGTWQELLWLRQTGLKLDPDVVIVQAHLNDAADNLWGTISWQGGGSNWLVQHSELARLVQRVAGASAKPKSGEPCQDDWKVGVQSVCWQRTEELLSELHTAAADAGAVTLLMPAPMRWQVESDVRDARAWVDTARYQDELRQYAQANGWLFVDPLPAFRQASANQQQSLFLDVGHPDEAGQRLIAQEIYNALNRANALTK